MAVAQRTLRLAAPAQEIWDLISDAHHMPRWWPGVVRMEGVSDEGFTQVFKTKKGRSVRLDFRIIASEPLSVLAWEQELPGTPFERVLNELIIEVQLEPVDSGTDVTLIQSQKLRGYSRTGGLMLRRATHSRLDEALEGLARICGPG